MEERDAIVVIANGPGTIQAGFAGKDRPRGVFPAAVFPCPARACGYSVGESQGNVDISRPIKHGVVESWEDMEKVWDHAFTDVLRIVPEERKIMITESPLNPTAMREKTVSVLFDTFSVSGIWLVSSPRACLAVCGKTTGIVVESDYDVTYVVPFYEGYALTHAIMRWDYGPFKSAEPLFQPSLVGQTSPGLHQLVVQSMEKCDPELHDTLCGNILLAGSNTMFPGFSDRLSSELARLLPWKAIKVIDIPEREHMAWTGCSILACLEDADLKLFTKEDYEKWGPEGIQYCF